MQPKTPVVYTLFPTNKATQGTIVQLSLKEFAAEAAKSYAQKESQPLAIPDQLPNNSRASGSTPISATCIMLDFDKTELTIPATIKILKQLGAAYVVYPTYSWKPGINKFRVVLPLSGPTDVVERRHIIARLGKRLPGIAPETSDSKRGFYVGTNGSGAPAPSHAEGLPADALELPAAPSPSVKAVGQGLSLKDNPLAKAQELVASLGHKLRDGEGRWIAVEFMATRLASRRYPEEQCWTWLGDLLARYFDQRDITDANRKQWEARMQHWLDKDRPKLTERIAPTKRPRPELRATQAGLPTSFSAEQLLKMDLPDTQWVLEGLLPPGLALIAGPPKAGKSQLMLDLALCVASGKPFLKKFASRKCKVLFFDLESGHHLLKERLVPTMGALNIKPKDLKGHMAFSLVMDTGANAILQLRAELAAEPELSLVVVDLFARIRDSENKERKSVYQLDYDTLSQFQDVCADHPDLCVLLVHHTNKRAAGQTDHWQDSISGSHGIAGATHTNFAMSRVSRQGMTEEEAEKMRRYVTFHATGKRVKDQDIILKQAGDGVSWVISEDSLAAVKASSAQVDILAVLKSDLERLWSAPEVAAELGRNTNSTKTVMFGMKKRGTIVSPTGKGYTLAENAGKTSKGPAVGKKKG